MTVSVTTLTIRRYADTQRGVVLTTHWNKKQQRRYGVLLRRSQARPGDCWLGYWCSDAHGYPVPGSGATRTVRAFPGAVHEISAEHPQACSPLGLHATLDPLHWPGQRVWAVAIHGPRDEEWDKVAGLRREVIGEVWPHEALDERLGARLGRRDLQGAYLQGAYLRGAKLLGAHLQEAILHHASLQGANLWGANLGGANLWGANLCVGCLGRANLQGANLGRADLRWADLRGADLRGADLRGAYLQGANLQSANLLHGVYRLHDIPGWKTVNGRLERE